MKNILLKLCIITLTSNLSSQVIFHDSFETMNGENNIPNLNTDIGISRQQNGLTSNYTMTGASVITYLSNNDDAKTTNNGMIRMRNNEPEMGETGTHGYLSLDTNFGASLIGKKYTVGYDIYYNDRNTSTTDQWVSFCLADIKPSGAPIAQVSDFGMLARPNGPIHPNSGKASFHSDGNLVKNFTDTGDYSDSYKRFLFTFDETGIDSTVSLSIDGTVIFSDLIIDFETNNRFLTFGSHLGPDTDTINNPTEFSDTFIDDLTITVIPEFSTLSFLVVTITLVFIGLKNSSLIDKKQ